MEVMFFYHCKSHDLSWHILFESNESIAVVMKPFIVKIIITSEINLESINFKNHACARFFRVLISNFVIKSQSEKVWFVDLFQGFPNGANHDDSISSAATQRSVPYSLAAPHITSIHTRSINIKYTNSHQHEQAMNKGIRKSIHDMII